MLIFKFSGSCLALAAIWEYENMRNKALRFRQKATGWIQKQHTKHVAIFSFSLITYQHIINLHFFHLN